MKKETRNNIIVFAAMLILALAVTYPGIADFTTRLLGIKDSYFYAWDLWWFHHSLFSLHQSPLKLQTIFYPISGAPYVWSSPINEIAGILLLPLLPLTVVFNILALLPIVLGAYFTYKLAYHLTRERMAGIVSGVLFGFSPFLVSTMMGNLQYASIEFIPLVVYMMLRVKEEQTLRNGLLFIAASVLLALSSPSYIFYAYVPVVLYLPFSWLVTDGWKALNKSLVLYLLLSMGLVALAALIFYEPQLNTLQHSEYARAQGVYQLLVNNQNFADYFLPNKANFFFKHLLYYFSKDVTYFSAIGIVTLFLIVIVAAFNYEPRESIRWGILAVILYILSLGPYLKFNGFVMFPYYGALHFIPLPYLYLSKIKLLANLTQPVLLIPLLLLSTAIIAGFGAKLIRERTDIRSLSFVTILSLIALALIEYYPGYPFPSVQATVPVYYTQIARDTAAKAIVELPASASVFDNRYDIPFIYRSMYYQIFTNKDLAGGYYDYQWGRESSLIKTTPFLSELNDPLTLRYGDIIPMNKDAIANYGIRELVDMGIGYVVVNRLAYDQADYTALHSFLTTYCGKPLYDDGYVSVYMLTRTYLSVHPGELLELGTGWFAPALNEKEGVVFRMMSQDGTIRVIGVDKPKMVRLVMGIIKPFKSIQWLTVSVNGRTINRIDLTAQKQPVLGWMSAPFLLAKGDTTIVIHSINRPVDPYKEIGPLIQDPRRVSIGVFGVKISGTTTEKR